MCEYSSISPQTSITLREMARYDATAQRILTQWSLQELPEAELFGSITVFLLRQNQQLLAEILRLRQNEFDLK